MKKMFSITSKNDKKVLNILGIKISFKKRNSEIIKLMTKLDNKIFDIEQKNDVLLKEIVACKREISDLSKKQFLFKEKTKNEKH